MRPLKLTLKNFLSYGEDPQTISFDVDSIISFVGNNGHGKSALLESITWALWGQARRGQGVSKSDDMIMHLGSSHMFVTLEIKVKNDHYKIHRTCEKKHNRIYTTLELYSIINEEEKNLSSSHQKDTQLLIEKIIGISYDMFINTVYLKQGNSNEFSKKTAKERKDILCSILKIDQIEQLRQHILDDIKIILQDRTVLLKLEERLLDTKKEHQLSIYQKDLHTFVTEKELIAEQFIQLEKTYTTFFQEQTNIATLYQAALKKKEGHEKQIETLYTAYKIACITYNQYKKAYCELEKINKYHHSALSIVDIEKDIIEKEQEKIDITNSFNNEIKEYQSIFQKKLEDTNNEIVAFLDHANDSTVLQLKQKLYHYNEILTQYQNDNEICYLCQDNITENITYQEYIEALKKNKIQLEKEIITYTSEKKTILSTFEYKKKEIITIHETQKQTSQQKYKKDIHQKDNELLMLFEKKKEYLLTLSYKEKKQFLTQEIVSFRNKDMTAQLKQTIKKLYEQKKELQKCHIDIISTKATIDRDEKQVYLYQQKISEYQKKNEELQKQITQLQSYITILEAQIAQDKDELTQLQIKIKETEQILKIKSNLAHILSKNNLQAALIEEAIPIIEEEANIILQKLTNGSSKIYIESIKDLKSGTIKETLDIKIADHIGLRYYEFFSGGESFRIDLALRIALVKLLAQKSGHHIKTFIIDEGFGSQDTQNLEIIIDTLYLLQNEFDLIIIISHLNDMKEQFPVQFYIEKTIQGSIIRQI
jgi:exonuclease SbcC